MKLGLPNRKLALLVAVTGAVTVAGLGRAADLSLPVTGDVLGTVVDAAETPQMGATVQLFNKYQRLLAKVATTPDGRFAFANLPVDVYSVRVSLASFLPASRDRIAVRPGLDSMLRIHLATLFSNVELTYTVPTGGMTDDWKWVLRSSPATRPINRILAEEDPPPTGGKARPQIFSGTRGMLSVSGGDGGLLDSDSLAVDMGTGFALSTNLLGKNQLQLAGTFGPGVDIGPVAMGLCAIYSREQASGFAAPPEVTLTVSQISRFGMQPGSGEYAIPAALGISAADAADDGTQRLSDGGSAGECASGIRDHRRICRLRPGREPAQPVRARHGGGRIPRRICGSL